MKGSSIVVLTFVEQWGEIASPNARIGPEYAFVFTASAESGGALVVSQHGHTNDMQQVESAAHLCVVFVF